MSGSLDVCLECPYGRFGVFPSQGVQHGLVFPERFHQVGMALEHIGDAGDGKRLDLPPEFDQQGANPLARRLPDPGAPIGLRNQQALLRQLQGGISNRSAAHPAALGQRFLVS